MTIRAAPWPAEQLRMASVEITQRCNNRCAYCDQTRSKRDMPLSRFQGLLDELERQDTEAVALGGGEPTLHLGLRPLLEAARQRELRTGLTTNGRAPRQVLSLAEAGLLDRFGVSAGKGAWKTLVSHPRAVTNLLLLRGGLSQVLDWATAAVRLGAKYLLLLSYKGARGEFVSTTDELADAFGLLTGVGRQAGITVAADTYTMRRLGLTETCGDSFVRFDLNGKADYCCFPTCEYRPPEPENTSGGCSN